MRSFSQPCDAKEMRRYLGMLNFYRLFLNNAATVLIPLYDIIKTHNKLPPRSPIVWSTQQIDAFEKSTDMLANAAYLAYPVPGVPVSIAADASDIAVAAVLQQQLPDGTIQPLAFFSRRLDPTQMLWSICGRELLAVYLGIKHFVHYLEGTSFTIYTDHSALISAAATGKLRDIPREVRHLQYIATIRPEWKPGSENITANT